LAQLAFSPQPPLSVAHSSMSAQVLAPGVLAQAQ
jgi:hypothetical protein